MDESERDGIGRIGASLIKSMRIPERAPPHSTSLYAETFVRDYVWARCNGLYNAEFFQVQEQ